GSSGVLCAIALEMRSPDPLATDVFLRLTQMDSPLVQVALERFLARFPVQPEYRLWTRPSWIDLTVPALAYESARIRILAQDLEPLVRLREGDAQAVGALGPYAVDVFALAGDGSDQDVVRELVRSFPTTPELLEAMGRVGLPSLFPRLLA